MAGNQAVVCDTNIIIELFKGNEEVKKNCLEIGVNNLCVSTITVGEFYYGTLNKKEMPLIEKHLKKFSILAINESVSDIFADLMRKYCLSHRPFIGDMLIAATALHHDLEIYTLNQKDFHFIGGLKLYPLES